MVAFSLRTWRRNGVACDELLFLPGTPHAQIHETNNGNNGSDSSQPPPGEGDVAAGSSPFPTNSNNSPSVVEMTARSSHTGTRSRSVSLDEISLSGRDFANSWEEDEDLEPGQAAIDQERVPLRSSSEDRRDPPQSQQSNLTERSMHAIRSSGTAETNDGAMDRFRENHPRITRMGSFFFFRSSNTSTQSAAYAPSGPSVVGAALDLSMPILFNFHLFIEAFNHFADHGGSETQAKILPLIFLTVLMVRTSVPPGRRGRFWGTMKFTFMAPFHPSRFRDNFLGDVLTSLVRPLQDIVFALAYYVIVVYGTLTAKYGLSDSGRILESSHILHNVVLPSCSLLPLWWKFLQTLREAYDSGLRWPYLGNSFKYLTAALVILYGMTHPEDRTSAGWIVCFMLALLYQLWWDTVMDWELFVIAPRQDETTDLWCTRISSVRPSNYILLALQRNIFQPVRDVLWFAFTKIPSWRQIHLRPRRLYKTDAFYWRIFVYNCVFRATWMLCYIPSYHLDGRSFKSDTHNYLGVLLPVAEILRRTFWGFLLLEVKTIQMTDSTEDNPSYSPVETNPSDEDGMANDSSKHGSRAFPWLGSSGQVQEGGASVCAMAGENCLLSLDDEMRHKLFIAELSVWALAFVGFGLWVTG